MKQHYTFLQTVRTEALAAEKAMGLSRAADAVRLAERVQPETIPHDARHAARQFVRLVFELRREVPAA